MKTFVTAILAALLCASVSAADPPPPPAATPILALRASGLSVPQVAFVGFMDELQSIRVENTDERLSTYVGDTARIRTWLGQMLRNHQAILVFDTQGQLQSGNAWQFEIPSQEVKLEFPRLDDTGSIASDVVAGIKRGPRLEIIPTDAEALLLDVSYRPAAFFSDLTEAPTSESRDALRSGQLSVPNGKSLVLLTNTDLDPVPLVVISAHDADELVTIHSNWPVPYTATVPRSAAEANPLAEIISGETAPSAALAQAESDPSYYREDDLQYFQAGPEYNLADNGEPAASSNPTAGIVADPAPETELTTPSADGELRFYPLIGPARLTASGDLVREDGSVVVPGDGQAHATAPRHSDVSAAENDIELAPGEPQTIEIHPSGVRRVILSTRIKSVAGFNPDVVSVAALTPNSVQIGGERTGATRLTIIDENDEALQLTVVVSSDVADLELLLERLYPDADVEVIPVRNTVLLRGTASDVEEVEQIVEIAEQFAPTVLNQLSVSGVAASVAIPPGFQVFTVDELPDVQGLEVGDFLDLRVLHGETGEWQNLLTAIEVFAVKTTYPGASRTGTLISLLVRPDEVEALKLAKEMVPCRFCWRSAPNEHSSEPRLNQFVLPRLKGRNAESGAASTTRQPPPASITSPYPTDVVPPGRAMDFRFLAIGIGTDPESLGDAEVGGLVDILVTSPGIGGEVSETIVERARLMGIVDPTDDDGRFVWVTVYPDDAETIENKMDQPDASFAVEASSVDYQYPVYPGFQSPGPGVQGPGPGVLSNADPSTTPAADPSESQPSQERASDLDALRNDIRALHEDVRRLIEVLEDRSDSETDDVDAPQSAPDRVDPIYDGDPAAAPIDDGVSVLFFNASWCGPCQQMQPIMTRLERDGFGIQAVDVDEQREIVEEHEIRSIPTFVFLYDGKEVNRLVGATTENDLRGRLASAAAPRNRSSSQLPNRTWTELGMRIETVASEDEQVADSPYRGAVRISEVREDSPADDAGLRADDLLVGLHIWETISPENVDYVLNHASVNTFAPLKFYVLRDGETLFGHFPQGASIGLEFSVPVGYRGAGRFVQLPATALPQGEDEAGASVDLLPLPAGHTDTDSEPSDVSQNQ